MEKQIFYDGLTSELVFLQTQYFEGNAPASLPHRECYRNTTKGREELAEVVSKETLAEILDVWGNEPITVKPIGTPAPTIEERISAVEEQMTDVQVAVTEAYEANEASNTALMLAMTEIYEKMLETGGEADNG